MNLHVMSLEFINECIQEDDLPALARWEEATWSWFDYAQQYRGTAYGQDLLIGHLEDLALIAFIRILRKKEAE